MQKALDVFASTGYILPMQHHTIPGIRLKTIRVDVTADPDFTRTKLAREIRANHGSYSEIRGYTDGRRCVNVRLDDRHGARLLAEVLKLPRRRDTLYCEVGADLAGVDDMAFCEARIDSIAVKPRDGESVPELLERIARLALKQAEAKIATGRLGWATDPEVQQKRRESAIDHARSRLARAKEELAAAQANLLEAEHEMAAFAQAALNKVGS